MMMMFALATLLLITSGVASLSLEERMTRLEDIGHALARQVNLQGFYNREMLRSDGDTGIMSNRLKTVGSKNYYSTSHIGHSFMAMHDHPEYKNTVGLGELDAVMNGYHFRTRHNDYQMVMPSRKSTDYHATEDILLPKVPRPIKTHKSIEGQTKAMRNYFEAFKKQDASIALYMPFFEPHLCYMEGAWTYAGEKLEEPFHSELHSLEAGTWKELIEKARFASYTGSSSPTGDNAFLPTLIYGVDNGKPLVAQWNYRILCHPVKAKLEAKVLEAVDDLSFRLPNGLTNEEAKETMGQRFYFSAKGNERETRGSTLLDNIMKEIPGKNNYQGHVEDHSLGAVVLDPRGRGKPMNTGFYHRYYRTLGRGAMGTSDAFRGYNDANLWVAQTTHDEVLKLNTTTCRKVNKTNVCVTTSTGYSFAIPLEIIYTNPLQNWNPYRLPIEGRNNTVKDVTEGGKRNGGLTVSTAFLGASSRHFYTTPIEFYSMRDHPVQNYVGVLDKRGKVRRVVASGVRTFTPDIDGVGRVRLRYPIANLFGEGENLWKELNAFKDMVMQQPKYGFLYEEEPCHMGNGTYSPTSVQLEVPTTYRNPPGEHSHSITIPYKHYKDMVVYGMRIPVDTSTAQGHAHTMLIGPEFFGAKSIAYYDCDGQAECWDEHPRVLNTVTEL